MDEIISLIIFSVFLVVFFMVFTNLFNVSTGTNQDAITITSLDTWIPLSKDQIEAYSETITFGGTTLARDVDYLMDYDNGLVYFCDGGC